MSSLLSDAEHDAHAPKKQRRWIENPCTDEGVDYQSMLEKRGVVVVPTAQLLYGAATKGGRGSSWCRFSIVLFALVLLASTLGNEGDEVLAGVIGPAQVAVLGISVAAALRGRSSRSDDATA